MMKLTRRHALTYLAAVPILSLISRRAHGLNVDQTDQSRLIVIHLRGALDGLAAVVPYADPDYRQARGALALAWPGQRGGVIDLDGRFGLHPALAPLQAFYAAGEMLIFPAIAGPIRTYAHDIGQAFLQTGGDRDGLVGSAASWLDRAALLLHPDLPVCRPAMAAGFDPLRLGLIADLCHGQSSIGQILAEGGWPTDLDMAFRSQATGFVAAARDAGSAVANGSGARVAYLDSDGWDTHADQGREEGRLAIALAGLADGISALATASGAAWRQTAILVVTEFGRAVRMNAMGGTDHGTASIALLLGGAVAGGRVLGSWPGLAPDKLYQGRDLMPTSDLQAVIKAVLIDHLDLSMSAVDRILPQSIGLSASPGLFRPPIA